MACRFFQVWYIIISNNLCFLDYNFYSFAHIFYPKGKVFKICRKVYNGSFMILLYVDFISLGGMYNPVLYKMRHQWGGIRGSIWISDLHRAAWWNVSQSVYFCFCKPESGSAKFRIIFRIWCERCRMWCGRFGIYWKEVYN